MPKNKYQKNKRKKQQKLSDETDQISNNLSTNMIDTCSQKQSNVLCEDAWGSGNGAHSLPSPSHITTLKNGNTCELVKEIQTSPYYYTIGSCLFDSALFCLSQREIRK